jgi:hypothetical protein
MTIAWKRLSPKSISSPLSITTLALWICFTSIVTGQGQPQYDVVIGNMPQSGKYSIRLQSNRSLSVLKPTDLLADHQGNIHIADAGSNRVITMDAKGNFLREVNLAAIARGLDPDSPKKILLAEDMTSNLYVNILDGEYESKILILDKDGNFKSEFPFKSLKPRTDDRVISFGISKQGYLLIGTMPAGLTRPNWNRPVYVYDLNGAHLGMTDYHHIDSRGGVYDIVRAEESIYVKKYSGPRKGLPKTTSSMTKLGQSLLSKTTRDHAYKLGRIWIIAGFDGEDNTYVTNGLVVKVFDNKLRERSTYSLGSDYLQQSGLIMNETQIKVSSDGSIFLYGIRIAEREQIMNAHSPKDFVLLKLRVQ